MAAKGGYLKILQWARENGCPWHIETCTYAVKNCHMDILKWARENGCPWDDATRRMAAQKGFELL
jgi:hypothetical protein